MTSASTPAPDHGPVGRALRYLPAVTLAAVVTVTSTSEWTLARTVLDLPPAVAWAVPVAIDSYVIAALRTRRDVGAAITVMAGALAAAMGAHLAAAEHPSGELPPQVTAPAAAAILSVLVIVAWRVHVLIDHLTHAAPYPERASTSSTPASGPSSSPHSPLAASAPAASSAPPGLPLGDPDGYADRRLAPGREASTGERRSAGAGGVAAAPRRTPDTAPMTTAGTGRTSAGLNDEQILADLRATGDGTSPGIRALKRTYAIGQTRAARIHQQITDQEAAAKSLRNPDQERKSEIRTEDDRGMHDQADHEIPPSQNDESHTRITDRVGPPIPPEEMPYRVAGPVLQPAREA